MMYHRMESGRAPDTDFTRGGCRICSLFINTRNKENSMSFNLKKTGSACAVAATLFAASWGAHADDPKPNPGQAVVKFMATVTAQTCTPEWQSDDAVTVDFKNVSVKDLQGTGSVGSALPFTLSLKECAGVQGVSVQAGGTADEGYAQAFANTNTASGAATGVGFVLLGGDKQTVMTPNDNATVIDYKMPVVTPASGSTPAVYATKLTMPFLAEFVATADTVGQGKATGEATLYMTYE